MMVNSAGYSAPTQMQLFHTFNFEHDKVRLFYDREVGFSATLYQNRGFQRHIDVSEPFVHLMNLSDDLLHNIPSSIISQG